MAKIGLFFGSFNPIHIGHLAIANYMAAFTDLTQVWFVVSPQNPLKIKESLLADYHRLALVEQAIADNPYYKACNIEFKLPKPSFTINTLVHLKETNPNKDFVLIMGEDNLQTLHKWKNYEQILTQFELYVYPRKNTDGSQFAMHPKVKKVDAPVMELSATFIRQAIKDKKDVSFFLHPAVNQYIQDMHFYEK